MATRTSSKSFMAFIAFLLFACPARGATWAPGTGWNLTPVGRWARGPCLASLVSGDTVYVGNGAVLEVVDFSDPAAPAVIGSVTVTGSVRSIVKDGDILYIASRSGCVVDVSSPASPSVLVTLPVDGGGAAVSGGYLYLSGDGLHVFDVSVPSNPVETSYLEIPGAGGELIVQGGYAYLVGLETGLSVIDISNPSSPSVAGSFEKGSSVWTFGLDVGTGYAYLAEGGPLLITGGLRVLDVSDPASPTELGFYNVGNRVEDVAVSGNLAYLANGGTTVRIVDVSDPASLSARGTYSAGNGYAYRIALGGTTAYVANGEDGLRAVDCSNPDAPSGIGRLDTGAFLSGLDVSGSDVFLAAGTDGMIVVDASDSTSPSAVGSLAVSGWANSVSAFGSYVYLGTGSPVPGEGGLRIADVSTPSSPVETGSYDPTLNTIAVTAAGNEAYIVSSWDGLRIVDISDPAAPGEIGYFPEPYLTGVAVGGNNRVYLTGTGTNSLYVLDVSDPTVPQQVGSIPGVDGFLDIALDGNFAYVASDTGGLRVLDLSAPDSPVEIARLSSPGAKRVALGADYIFLARGGRGLDVYYKADPANPLPVGHFTTYGSVEDLVVVGNRVYAADDDDGLYLLLFDPPPTRVAVASFSAEAHGDRISLAWEVDSDEPLSGFALLRTSVEGEERILPGPAELLAPGARGFEDREIVPGKGYRYVLAVVRENGSRIYSPAVFATVPQARLVLHPNRPNPFRSHTTISFELPGRAAVDLTVYDALGRPVRNLVSGIVNGGSRRVVWDGKDELGRKARAGVYFYRLRAGKSTLSGKMVLIR